MAQHPLPSKLLDFVLGRVNEIVRNELTEHLESCEECQQQCLALQQQHAGRRDVPATLAVQPGGALGKLPKADQPQAPTLLHGSSPSSERATGNFSTHIERKDESGNQTGLFSTQAHVPSAPQAMKIQVGQLIGPYLIEAMLGQGGMGAVYRARHTKLDKVVALKILPSQSTQNPQFVARFEREMKAVGKLDHPQIVRALDAGELDGVHYLAMEYIEGTDLHELIRSRGCLSVVNACKAVRQAAQALAAAHAAGLVHRDIKPANLFLAKSGQLKVLDLGLALLGEEANAQTELTAAGQTFGTPDYMAPEQWESAHASDGRVDLYALGCTLFFLLTGRAPYDTDNHKTLLSKMKAHAMAAVPSLRDVRSDVPAELEALYQKLLAKEPDDRVQKASELVDALLPFTTKIKTPTTPEKPAANESSTTVPTQLGSESVIDPLNNTPISQPLPTDIGSSARSDSLVIHTSAFSKPLLAKNIPATASGRKAPKRIVIFAAAGVAALGLLCLAALTSIRWAGAPQTEAATQVHPSAENVAAASPDAQATPSASNSPLAPSLDNNSNVSAAASANNTTPGNASSSKAQSNLIAAEDAELGPVNYEAERSIAAWALNAGGVVTVSTEAGEQVKATSLTELPKLPYALSVIRFDNRPIDDECLQQLAGCRRLRGLHLDGTRITGHGLLYLKELRSLIDLVVTWQKNSQGEPTHLSDQSLSSLATLSALPRLKLLNLAGNFSLTDASVEHVAKLAELESLTLGGRVGRDGLDKLSGLHKLKFFSAADVQASNEDLKRFIEQHPLIAELTIEGGKTTTSALPANHNLHLYAGRGTSIDNSSLSNLRNMPELKALRIMLPEPFNIPQVMHLPELEEFTLLYEHADLKPLSLEKYALLARHPSIKRMHLGGVSGSPDDERLLKLASMPQLELLHIGFQEQSEKRNFTSAGIQRFRQQRPDVTLNVHGVLYEAQPDSVPAIQLGAIESFEQLSSTITLEKDATYQASQRQGVPKPASKSIAAWPALAKSSMPLKLKPGTPISSRALVGSPPVLKDLASWTIEPLYPLMDVESPTFSPDGKRVATGGTDAIIRIWQRSDSDPTQLKPIQVLAGENQNISALCWSHSGEFLAIANHNGKQISIYDGVTGQRVRTIPIEAGSRLLTWSPNDRYLAVTGWGICVIDLQNNSQAKPADQGNYETTAWSPDSSQLLAIEMTSKSLRQWQVEGLTKVAESPIANPAQSSTPAWSPDGSTVVIGTEHGHLLLWDPVSHRFARDVPLVDSAGRVNTVAWEPPQADGSTLTEHGTRLMVVSDKLTIFNQQLDKPLLVVNTSSTNGGWLPAGDEVFVGMNIYDSKTGQLKASNGRAAAPARSSNLSRDGKLLRCVKGKEMQLFDAETGDFVKRIVNIPAAELLGSPKDDWLLNYSLNRADNQLFLIDTATYEKRIPLVGHEAMVTTVSWSPSGQHLATGSKDRTVRIWQASNAKEVRSLMHASPVQSVAWSTDGKQLVTCTADGMLRLWNADNGAVIKDYGKLKETPTAEASSMAWSPLAPTVAIGSVGGYLNTVDLRTGAVSDTLANAPQALFRISWSPDGKMLVANSYGNNLIGRLTGGKPLPIIEGCGAPQWFPDSRRLVTCSLFGNPIQAFDMRRGTRIGALIPHMPGEQWAMIGTDGNYRGSPGIESELAFVALHKDGSQTLHTAAEFEREFGWKNDPSKASLSKLNAR